MFHNFVFVIIMTVFDFGKVRLLRDNHPPNLANMKEVQICSDKTKYLTDDDYLDEKSFIPSGCSDDDIEITVKLIDFRRINYVILYSSRTVDSGDDPLDRFNVYMLDTNQTKWWCGRFPRPINMTKIFSKGFRVNCINHYKNFNKVLIVLEDQTQFQLAEIGVYSLALPGQAFHRGCFYSEEAEGYAETISNLSLANCISTCENEESLVMIGKNKCACGDVTWLEREVNMSECENCLEVERCGGQDAYSVYLLEFQLPYVRGCLKYYQNQTEVPNVTIKECIHRCDGDIFSWITANQCGCLNIPKLFRRPETQCQGICMENEDQICEKESLIITNCMEQSNYQFHCNKLFHCLNGNYDQYGICIEGCEDGWFGLHCIERDQGLATFTTNGISISVPLSTTVRSGIDTVFDGTPISITPLGGTSTPYTSLDDSHTPEFPLNGTPTPVTPLDSTPTPVTPLDSTPTPVTPLNSTPTPVTPLDGTPTPVTPLDGTPTPDTSPDSSLDGTPTSDIPFDGHTFTTDQQVIEISTSNNIFNYFVFILWLAAWSLFESPY